MTSKIGELSTDAVVGAAQKWGTPIYLYDEATIRQKCENILAMPNAYGLKARYAMKANSNMALLKLINNQGIGIDASSFNEVKRAHRAGIPLNDIMLTSQEVLIDEDRKELEQMMLQGLGYNVCSRLQLDLIADFAAANNIKLSMRVHPGVGSGESASRNTGDKYSCFGIHLTNLPDALAFANSKGLIFDTVHVHIGSGGDPEAWRDNIDRELGFVEEYFPDATTANFGGGFKVARMPSENEANIVDLGEYAKSRFEKFYQKTGRKLRMEVEPGTYYVANSGYLVTRVMDKKQTGSDGFQFIIVNGGMEVNSRPLLYGSEHPFFVVAQNGTCLSNEFDLKSLDHQKDERIIVGRCCESGDSQSLDATGRIVPRVMASPEIGDYVVVGGCGAYCSAMTPFNYNSHVQAAEILVRTNGVLKQIRKTQTLDQIVENEIPLED